MKPSGAKKKDPIESLYHPLIQMSTMAHMEAQRVQQGLHATFRGKLDESARQSSSSHLAWQEDGMASRVTTDTSHDSLQTRGYHH